MKIEENERYTFYSLALEKNDALSDTYPVVMQIMPRDRVIARFQKNIDLKINAYYKITGIGILYKEKRHILVESFEPLDGLSLSEYEKEKIITNILGTKMVDYMEYQNYIEESIEAIENNIIKEITKEIYNKYKNDFLEYPAATKFHHAYKHGLVLHTYNVLRLGHAYIDIYGNINKDLVTAGIILHDIMKIKEIAKDSSEYTVEGKLIGHISLASNELIKCATLKGYQDTEEVMILNHIILSHHGEGEYGSPKEPQVLEALIVHLSDLADAKIIPSIEALEKIKTGEYTEQIFVNDRNKFYKHKLSK